MSSSIRKSAVLCLLVASLTTSALGASRAGTEPGGFFAFLKHKIIHILDFNEVGWPRP